MTLLLEIEPTRDGARLWAHPQVVAAARQGMGDVARQLEDPLERQADPHGDRRAGLLGRGGALLEHAPAGGGIHLAAAELDTVERAVATARTRMLYAAGVQDDDDVTAHMQDPVAGRTLAALTLLLQSVSKFRLTGALRVTDTRR